MRDAVVVTAIVTTGGVIAVLARSLLSYALCRRALDQQTGMIVTREAIVVPAGARPPLEEARTPETEHYDAGSDGPGTALTASTNWPRPVPSDAAKATSSVVTE